jgi:predicted aconitase with swiveling domain
MEPLSFWGGVDPATGALTDPRSPHHGRRIGGTILMVPETRGSSSSSAVMLELLASGRAPAALLLDRIDAILGLGVLVAREMGWPTIPLLVLPASEQAAFADGEVIAVAADGTIERL